MIILLNSEADISITTSLGENVLTAATLVDK